VATKLAAAVACDSWLLKEEETTVATASLASPRWWPPEMSTLFMFLHIFYFLFLFPLNKLFDCNGTDLVFFLLILNCSQIGCCACLLMILCYE